MLKKNTFLLWLRSAADCVAVFALLWAVPRFWLFTEAAMMHDDYFMGAYDNVYDVFFIREYRILGGVFPSICKFIFPGFYGTNIPIYINALLMGGICALVYRLLLSLDCSRIPAVAATLLLCWHPVVNDISAWNTMGFALTSAILVMSGFYFAWRGTARGIICGAICVTCSLATYQLMMPLPMCMTILCFFHIGVFQHRWEWKRSLSVAASMLLATGIYLIYVAILSPLIFGPYDGAGLKSFGEVIADRQALVMQTTNLYLNLLLTPYSFYLGLKPSLSLWYYTPMAIAAFGAAAVAVGVIRNRISLRLSPLVYLSWLTLPFLAIAPLWFIPLYTEWRISFIVLIAQVMVIGSIVAATERVISPRRAKVRSGQKKLRPNRLAILAIPAPLAIIALVLVPVTVQDCRMRIDDYQHDLSIVESIRDFRSSLGDQAEQHRVAYVESDRNVLLLTGNEHPSMKANYVINTYSTFSYGRIWGEAMFRWYELDWITKEELSEIDLSSSANVTDRQIARYADLPYVRHYPAKNISVVVGSPQWFTWTTESR